MTARQGTETEMPAAERMKEGMRMEISIRGAQKEDFEAVSRLLFQIAQIHHQGRPDLFKDNTGKYSEEEFLRILEDETKPVFVAQDTETKQVLGYAFCKINLYGEQSVLRGYKSLYLDDLCVDETVRGAGIGRRIIGFLKEYAKKSGCYNMELNVWECNPGAISFYDRNGFETQRRRLEWIVAQE